MLRAGSRLRFKRGSYIDAVVMVCKLETAPFSLGIARLTACEPQQVIQASNLPFQSNGIAH